ncbi:hypothetical protein M9Y10_004135 [Tritrichomonas musculus]|uniref:DUF3447 domain-containing protein n=1 Tax=Tritrichomonas musculus TaxID=1915356 RepID=A0ABR2JR68_9EUKA
METQDYVKEKKDLRKLVLHIIEDENGSINLNQIFDNILIKQKIREKPEELRLLLYLINKISKNHHRNPHFFNQIEKILLYLEKEIKQTFSNYDLFCFFKSNKRVLLFLLTKKIITIDKTIFSFLYDKDFKEGRQYCTFLYPEVKTVADEDSLKDIEDAISKQGYNDIDNFDERRLIGENDSYICTLIRNDSLNDFISLVTEKKIQLTSQIKPSIFETNSFLLVNKPSLIEYAAFFGSIQIFNYLQMNHAELNPSLWFYVIHSKSIQLINFLVENHIKPDDISYVKCLIESIKCHHDDITRYIQDNLLNTHGLLGDSFLECCFRYYNYEYFPENLSTDHIFIYLCQCDYLYLVKFLVKEGRLNINATLTIFNYIFISNSKINYFFLMMKFLIYFILNEILNFICF